MMCVSICVCARVAHSSSFERGGRGWILAICRTMHVFTPECVLCSSVDRAEGGDEVIGERNVRRLTDVGRESARIAHPRVRHVSSIAHSPRPSLAASFLVRSFLVPGNQKNGDAMRSFSRRRRWHDTEHSICSDGSRLIDYRRECGEAFREVIAKHNKESAPD